MRMDRARERKLDRAGARGRRDSWAGHRRRKPGACNDGCPGAATTRFGRGACGRLAAAAPLRRNCRGIRLAHAASSGPDPAGLATLRANRFVGAARSVRIEALAHGGEQRVMTGVLSSIRQVEAVVETLRISSLIVLQDRLELVEPLGEAGLQGAARFIVVP